MNTPEDYAEALKRWAHWQATPRIRASGAIDPCTVELFGVRTFAGANLRDGALVLPAGATFAQRICGACQKLPMLVGRVITADRATPRWTATPAT